MPFARVPFEHLSRAELDHQLSPSRIAKDFLAVLTRHEAETASLDHDPGLRRIKDIACGDLPRQRLDLTLPLTPPPSNKVIPCLMFVHGGFWQEGSKAGSCFAARACAKQGWAHAAAGYTLAPDARLGDIVAETGQALLALQREGTRYGIDPDRIVIAGHSAGGHLCAAVLAGLAGTEAANAVRGAVLISGVYDLRPVAASYVNDVVRISEADVLALSPLLAQPRPDVPVHILVGQQESDAFQCQALALRAAWSPRLSRLTFESVPGRDHFDVLDELTSPTSDLWAALRQMAQ